MNFFLIKVGDGFVTSKPFVGSPQQWRITFDPDAARRFDNELAAHHFKRTHAIGGRVIREENANVA